MSREGADPNRKPEQKARGTIEKMLAEAGWKVHSKSEVVFFTASPTDDALLTGKKLIGVIGANPEVWGQLTTVDKQSIARLQPGCRRAP